ncbi:MAG: hypothetical protein VYA67_14330 [Actinomycetota bacterium]|nr:hypothetical protein [Actinomycetota bacterium]
MLAPLLDRRDLALTGNPALPIAERCGTADQTIRYLILRIAEHWPWAEESADALNRVRTIL